MNKLPISVCIISGAEAHRIRKALESVAGWTNEIVLVLNEETHDGTEEIAREFGARIFREKWKGNIAQKNSVLEKAEAPWILAIDADEVVSPALREEITRLFSETEDAKRHPAYDFPRCTFYCGRWIRHGDWYPDRQTRLWRKGHARWGGIDPHDRLLVDGAKGKLHNDLQHFSNDSINRQIQKIIPFSDAFVEQNLAAGRISGWSDFLIRPVWRFVRGYLLRLGFLDGWPGYYIAWMAAFSAVTRHIKIREAQLLPPKK